MKKALFYIVLIALLGVFGYSAYRVGSYMLEKHRAEESIQEAAQFVHIPDHSGVGLINGDAEFQGWMDIDFDGLLALNSDVVGWLYGPGTGINYPVAQAEDNDYYLRRLLNGDWNENGTLFLDYRCDRDFSQGDSLIYGHHMDSGIMFGSLVEYKDQSYYDKHPYMYLATPDGQYRVELFAGCLTGVEDDVYQLAITEDYLRRCMESSTFQPDHDIPIDGPVLALSTCSYEFKDARYVVYGALVPLEE